MGIRQPVALTGALPVVFPHPGSMTEVTAAHLALGLRNVQLLTFTQRPVLSATAGSAAVGFTHLTHLQTAGNPGRVYIDG
jgi:hypothetical protein